MENPARSAIDRLLADPSFGWEALAELARHVTDGVYLLDTKRRILFWNPAAERITGWSADDVVGSHCHDNLLVHADGHGCALCLHRCPAASTLDDGQPREHRLLLHHRCGARIPVRVRTQPLRDRAGQLLGVLEVFSDASPEQELRERLGDLQREAYLDRLTSLPTRRFLERQLDARLGQYRRWDRRLGVLFIDIDTFKAVNDRWGHAAGDAVLVMVAGSLAHGVRRDDEVGRWAGDEFVVLAEAGEKELAELGERLRTAVDASFIAFEGTRLTVTVSIGGATARPRDSRARLLHRADLAMYASKRAGRNRVHVAAGE